MHDAVLATAAAQRPQDMATWSLQWAWLYEFEQNSMKKQPKKDRAGNETVDEVLAAYWP